MFRFLVFLAFLVAYGLWIWACFVAAKWYQSAAAEGHTFWVNHVMAWLTIGGFFGFVFILSGIWSWSLLLMFLAASELGIVASLVVSVSLGLQASTAYLRTAWLATELNLKRVKIATAMPLIISAIYLVYPVVIGFAFFTRPLFSRAAQTWVVEQTVLYVIFGAYPLTLFTVIPLLKDKNLDEGTRQSIFLNQLAGAIPTALFAAVGFWAFRVGPSGQGSGAMSLSMWAFILIFLLFALSSLIPFLLGTQLGRRQRLGFLKQTGDFLSRLTGILESPTPATYVTKLTELIADVTNCRKSLVNSDLALQSKADIEAGAEAPAAVKILADAIQQTGDLDPRFIFEKSLAQMENELTEIAQDLQKRAADTVERAAAKWCRKYRLRREELDKEVQSATASKAWATVIISTGATTIVSGILSAVGKEASSVMAQYGMK